jgi:hypothetical protein
VHLPKDRKAMPCKWILTRKLLADGSIDKYKARLVIKGFHQRPEMDYKEIFAPVVRASTMRYFFSLVASFDLECHTIDISNAFLLGELEEPVFMEQPPGYADGSQRVCALYKSLYGLKQAPRVWNKTVATFLSSVGFKQCKSDACIYTRTADEGLILILVYVDDFQIAARSLHVVKDLKACILKRFPGKDLGDTTYFLQMSIERNRTERTITLKQQRHIDKIVDNAGLSKCNGKSTPLPTNFQRYTDGEAVTEADALTQYKSFVGAILHVSNQTRPDVAFTINFLSRFMSCPTTLHFSLLRWLIKYLRQTASFGLELGGLVPVLYGFCDSDYAADTVARKSTSGMVIMCGIGAVAWKSRRQATTSTSTTEAEYIAAGETSREAQYFYNLASQLGISQTIEIGIDNAAALALLHDPLSSARTKHIDVIHHHVRERIQMQQLDFEGIPSAENTADIFTKALPRDLFEKHRRRLGVC